MILTPNLYHMLQGGGGSQTLPSEPLILLCLMSPSPPSCFSSGLSMGTDCDTP